MTEPIAIKFSGDCWNNADQFQQQINQHPLGEPLILDMQSEGPSLESLGVTRVINEWLKNRNYSPEIVHIEKFYNAVEFVPYRRIGPNTTVSHCFSGVKEYWQSAEPTLEKQLQYLKPFGLFIGRLTMSRAVILYKLMRSGTGAVRDQIFASLMKNTHPFPWQLPDTNRYNLENISDWLPLYEQVDMFNWFEVGHISSVDSKKVEDQFCDPMAWVGTNTSLLQHYHNFAVEIVCETYTLGNTFFPSEKTIRPLMAAKPIIVYGPRYYLARLREMGFRTFNEIWDESYDLYQGTERWNLMRKTMNRLLECGRSDQHTVLSRAHEIAMHNRRHLESICRRTS